MQPRRLSLRTRTMIAVLFCTALAAAEPALATDCTGIAPA